MKKRLLFFISMFIVLYPFTVKADEPLNGLVKENGYTYYYVDGVKQSGFQIIGGDKYFFSRVGDNQMRTGIFAIDGVTYYFDESGVMQTGWYEENGNKYYFDESGRASGFKDIGPNRYFFSRVGDNQMRTGIFAIDGVTYYFAESGVMQTGWYEENGNKYYFDESGRASGFKDIGPNRYFFSRVGDNQMRTGIFAIDGVTYHFDESGVMQTGWYEENGNKYYFGESGRASGFTDIDGDKYFFSRVGDNQMRTGIFAVDGYTYCFLEDGKMYNFGWYESEEGSRYFASNGQMQIGIIDINGSKYFLGPNGIQTWGFQQYNGETYFFSRINDHAMRTGFFKIDYNYHYFNEDGVMQTGFQVIEGIKRFFSRLNGAMRTSWVLIDGYMYYFDPDTGEMTIGDKIIDSVNYVFNQDGKLRDGFVTDLNGNTKYYYPDGTFANDWVTITGKKYFFNSLGVMIGANVKKIIDVSTYQGWIDWDTVVSRGGVDGVILRVNENALDYEDSMLARNIAEVQRLGIPYGIYIYSYAENRYEGSLYAEFALNVIRKYNMNPTLGIYLDLEDNGITNHMLTYDYEEVTRGFMDTMTNNGYGGLSKIYTYLSMANGVLNSSYIRSLITWISQFNHYCYYQGDYSGWQYSSTETIPGINGNVDVSVWFK